MYNDKADEFLAHYGVLGMKWGVRKDRGSSKPRQPSKFQAKRQAKKEQKKERTAEQKQMKEVGAHVTKHKDELYDKVQKRVDDEIKNNSYKPFADFEAKWEAKTPLSWKDTNQMYDEAVKLITDRKNDLIKDSPNRTFTTSNGVTYIAGYTVSSPKIMWGTKEEWEAFNSKNS